jgi:hypothetical protein
MIWKDLKTRSRGFSISRFAGTRGGRGWGVLLEDKRAGSVKKTCSRRAGGAKASNGQGPPLASFPPGPVGGVKMLRQMALAWRSGHGEPSPPCRTTGLAGPG